MCHYDQLTFPVPAVIVARLKPPLGELSVPVKPAPIIIVRVSGYFRITTPDPPARPLLEPSTPEPPSPVFAAPALEGEALVPEPDPPVA
jgi:hypothetical protein